MGQARVLGRDTTLKVTAGGQSVSVGEIDKFNAKKVDELKKSQPLGAKLPTGNVVHAGWELSIDGGKINWALAQMVHAQDAQITLGGRSPLFEIEQRIEYYDGSVETFVYTEVSLYGYEIDMGSAMDEMTEKISGFATGRKLIDGTTSPAVKGSYNDAIDAVTASVRAINSSLVNNAQGTKFTTGA